MIQKTSQFFGVKDPVLNLPAPVSLIRVRVRGYGALSVFRFDGIEHLFMAREI